MSAPAAPPSGDFTTGLLFAIGAAVAGAVAWAVLTVATDYKIGFAAVGIGLVVGKAVELQGGGDSRLPVYAAVIALLGCVLGDLLTDAHVLASTVGASYGTVLSRLAVRPSVCVDLFRAGFTAYDLVFYVIAAAQGYRFAAIGVRRAQQSRFAPPTAPPTGPQQPQWPAPYGETPA